MPRKIRPEASHGALELEAATVQSTDNKDHNEPISATWQAKGLEGLEGLEGLQKQNLSKLRICGQYYGNLVSINSAFVAMPSLSRHIA